VLANLYGEPDTLKALAKLAAQRETLRKERDGLAETAPQARYWRDCMTQRIADGNELGVEDERGRLLANRLLKRLGQVEKALADIAKNGAVIKKHCKATSDEIQAAIRDYKAQLKDAEAEALAAQLAMVFRSDGKAKLRRLAICPEPMSNAGLKSLATKAGLI
jgi:hypothetical protein